MRFFFSDYSDAPSRSSTPLRPRNSLKESTAAAAKNVSSCSVRRRLLECSIVFAAHDPGALNHVRPLYAEALRLGAKRAMLLDLRAGDYDEALLTADVVVCGASTAAQELELFDKAREAYAPLCVTVLEFGPERLGTDPSRLPDAIIATSEAGARQSVEHLRLCSLSAAEAKSRVRQGGWAHLEALQKENNSLLPKSKLVPFFAPCEEPAVEFTMEHIVAVVRNLLEWSDCCITVRPHPRSSTSLRTALRDLCVGGHLFDEGGTNAEVLRRATCSLSLMSTVRLESTALGTPSAFFVPAGVWPGADRALATVTEALGSDRPLKTQADLRAFFLQAADKTDTISHEGATARCWEALEASFAASLHHGAAPSDDTARIDIVG